jgi:hypothetical protein
VRTGIEAGDMSQLLRRFHAHSERIDDERKVARIVLESGVLDVTATVAKATLPGDNRRLRGIPVVARGVSGVSPGTHPSDAMR